MSLMPSQSASQSVSQSSGSFTNLPHAGGDAIEKHLSEEHAQRIIKGFKKFFDEDYNEQGSAFHQQSVQTRPNYLIDECNGLRQYICNYLMTTLRVRPEWREKKKKSERSCKTRSVLYLEILGLCADIEQDRTG
jgi:hypothetical protein